MVERSSPGSKPDAKTSNAGRLRALALAYWPDASFLAALVALNAFVRWMQLEPIENGGDPLDAWYFVKQLAHESHPATAHLNHHTSRWGMHWITWVVQHIAGPEPRYYYYPQLIASCATVGLTYLLGRQVQGRLAGVLAAIWLVNYELFHSASCQLRRGIFEALYAAAALNCLVRYLDREDERGQVRWIVACGVSTFMAYLVELPSLYICPGVALAVWLARKRLRHIVIYAGVLAGLFAVETATYALLTHYSSRLGVLSSQGGHLSLNLRGGHEGVPFSYLLERFTKVHESTALVYYPFFLLAPVLAFRAPPKLRAVALSVLSFAFLMTFFVRGINPIRVFQLNADRYILLGVPLAIVATVAAVLHALALARRALERGARRLPAVLSRYAAPASALAFGLLVVWVGKNAWAHRRRPHALVGVEQTYDLINDAFSRGLPIVANVDPQRGPEPAHRARALHWATKGFVRDDLLMVGKRLPDFSYVKGTVELDDKHRFIPPSLTPERARELMDQGCSVRLRVRGSNVDVSPSAERLPARCGR